MKNKAFTLIELLVVVLIIGILAAIALPHYQTAVDKANYSSMIAAVRRLRDAQQVYKLANGVYADNIADLGSPVPAGCTISTSGRFATCEKFSLAVTDYGSVYGQLLDEPKNVYQMFLSGRYITCVAYKANEERGRRLCKAMGGRQTTAEINEECDGKCTSYSLL